VNYLAHFHLSDGNDDLIIGALLGDHVKGILQGNYPPGWEQGIRLHRSIDAFTDQYPDLKKVQQLFAPEFRRYSGIMLDVVFDHFLNRHWHTFHHTALSDFSQQIYRIINNAEQLPETANLQAANLRRYDVLASYQHWQTVDMVLGRIGQRLRRSNPLADSAKQLQGHYAELEAFFLDFYPQLQQHVATQREIYNRE